MGLLCYLLFPPFREEGERKKKKVCVLRGWQKRSLLRKSTLQHGGAYECEVEREGKRRSCAFLVLAARVSCKGKKNKCTADVDR